MIDAVSIDAEADAPIDAGADAAIDARPSPSQCSTTAEVIVDVRPSQLASFAVQGDVLYYATYQLDPATQEVLDGELHAIDLVMGLIHSRGHTTRGGYDGEDGCERRPRAPSAASIHG